MFGFTFQFSFLKMIFSTGFLLTAASAVMSAESAALGAQAMIPAAEAAAKDRFRRVIMQSLLERPIPGQDQYAFIGKDYVALATLEDTGYRYHYDVIASVFCNGKWHMLQIPDSFRRGYLTWQSIDQGKLFEYDLTLHCQPPEETTNVLAMVNPSLRAAMKNPTPDGAFARAVACSKFFSDELLSHISSDFLVPKTFVQVARFGTQSGQGISAVVSALTQDGSGFLVLFAHRFGVPTLVVGRFPVDATQKKRMENHLGDFRTSFEVFPAAKHDLFELFKQMVRSTRTRAFKVHTRYFDSEITNTPWLKAGEFPPFTAADIPQTQEKPSEGFFRCS
jgi:hypothetical protein